MNVEEFREYCLSFKGVQEKMPFLDVADQYSRDVLCFYVGSKWFCQHRGVRFLLFEMRAGEEP